MRRTLTRRAFLGAGAGAVLGSGPGPRGSLAPAAPGGLSDFPRQDLELVREIVRVAHFDLDAVRDLVSERPALAKAGWDWGFGDWETPLGAASHTGRREIAELVVSRGARPGLLTLAMLGELEAVRETIEARPEARRVVGPHGLTLLHHARAGGDEAAAVVDYLEEIGGADPRATDLPLSAEGRRAFLGTYELESNPSVAFEIVERGDHVAFRRGESAPRNLMHQGGHEFHPVGAPAVRLRFQVRGGRTARVEIVDGSSTVTANRSG